MNKSFTLVEVLVAAAVLGIVVTAVSQLFVGSQRMWGQDLALVELQQKVRWSLQRLSKDIKQGSSVNVLDQGEKISFSDPEGNQVSYYLNGNQLIKDAGTPVVIAGNIENLNFACLPGTGSCSGGVVIEIEGQKQGGQRQQVFSLKSEVGLRNE